MLSLALFTPDPDTAYVIDQLVAESNQFHLVSTETPIPPAGDLMPSLKRFDPEVILLDLSNWNDRDRTAGDTNDVVALAQSIQASDLRGIVIGFVSPGTAWSRRNMKPPASSIFCRCRSRLSIWKKPPTKPCTATSP